MAEIADALRSRSLRMPLGQCRYGSSVGRGVPVAVSFELIGDRPAGTTDETKGVAALAFASSRAFGYKPAFIPVSTDANVPMSLGIPAIAIGSGGSGGGEHSPIERIDVAPKRVFAG